MATTEERFAAHDATLVQMNERLGVIEARLTGLETRVLLAVLGIGGWLSVLMTIYKFW